MSTTTQRPTPETDAAIKKTWPADAISLAVKLERQRDEARAEAERLLVVESQQKDQIEAMREAIKEAWIQMQYAESSFAGLALRVCPNDSAVDSVLNRMTEAITKLQPFLP